VNLFDNKTDFIALDFSSFAFLCLFVAINRSLND